MQLPKLKKLIYKSIAQNLKLVSLTMEFNLLLSNLTAIAKVKKLFVSETHRDIFFQFMTESCKLEPILKVAKLFCHWLGVTGFVICNLK